MTTGRSRCSASATYEASFADALWRSCQTHAYVAVIHSLRISVRGAAQARHITVWRTATGLTIHDGYSQTETANPGGQPSGNTGVILNEPPRRSGRAPSPDDGLTFEQLRHAASQGVRQMLEALHQKGRRGLACNQIRGRFAGLSRVPVASDLGRHANRLSGGSGAAPGRW